MALTKSVIYNSATRMPVPAGDSATVIYAIAMSGTYPAGGEPIDFSVEFKEVYAVATCGAGFTPAVGVTTGAIALGFERLTTQTGVIRGFTTGAVVSTELEEIAAGAYPVGASFRMIVVGRPSTDAS